MLVMAILPRAQRPTVRLIARINGLIPVVLGAWFLMQLPALAGAALMALFSGAPNPGPDTTPGLVHLGWIAIALAALITSPLLYHGWRVGRVLTVSVGLLALGLAVYEMLFHPFRSLVLLFGALWPAIVVAYLALFADESLAADTEPTASVE
jgi:hypothetical protein